MKRRDFVLRAGSSAGIILLGGPAAASPCAPQRYEGDNVLCPGGDAEADWLARTSGPGVVWFHDFRSDDEVNNFRTGAAGVDKDDSYLPTQGQCVRNTSDGITGDGCLELIYRKEPKQPDWVAGTSYKVGDKVTSRQNKNVTCTVAHTSDASMEPFSGGSWRKAWTADRGHSPGWWRPFSPMSAASTGKSVDDPAAGGAIQLQPWDPTNSRENQDFRQGYYAHPSYIGATDNGVSFDDSQFDGSEFWLQFRVKIDPERYQPDPNIWTPGGKLLFLATTQQTLNQEIVHQNGNGSKNNYSGASALWYTNFGSSPPFGGSMRSNDGYFQPGGPYEVTGCSAGNGTSKCWVSTPGEWETFLYHMVPGTHGNQDTLFEVYAARQGATSYELLFSTLVQINFSTPTPNRTHPRGWNSFQPSTYMNNQYSDVSWYQRYDQIIFSHDFIPCPQV